MKTSDVYALFMIGAVISLLGFIVENIWISLTKGYMDNRGMFLPFLIGYGIAVMLIYIVLGVPKNVWFLGRSLKIQNKVMKKFVYFLAVAVCICIGEMALGLAVEKVCHFSWWDYRKIPFHITQYTSIPTSAGFSVLITTFMDHVFEPLFFVFQSWNGDVLRVVSITLIVGMVLDYLYNAVLMFKHHSTKQRWKIDTSNTKIYKWVHSL